MQTLAVISALTVFGSLPFVSAQEVSDGTATATTPGYGKTTTRAPSPENPTSPLSANCPPGGEAIWFSALPREVLCTPTDESQPTSSFVQAERDGACDINGDGQPDYHTINANIHNVIMGGVPQQGGGGWILVSELSEGAGAVTSTALNVKIFGAELASWGLENFPQVADMTVYLSSPDQNRQICGWRDMDRDGDKDFLVFMRIRLANDGLWRVRQVWFENIGYEKPNPSFAADLNGDGWVNGLDLGLLLGAWGTNS
jgi:hypothetical protein